MFNSDQVKSFFRSLVIGAGAYFVGKGWVGQELMVEIAGGAAAMFAAVWGLYFHSGVTKVALAEVVLEEATPMEAAKVEIAAEKIVGSKSPY